MAKVIYLLLALVPGGTDHVGYYADKAQCEEARKALPDGWHKGLFCIPVDGSINQSTGQLW